MAIIAHFPRCPVIEGTLDGGALNTVFPPSDFNVGQFLFVRDTDSLYQCLINGAGNRFWFPVSNSGIGALVADLAPMHFAGGVGVSELGTVIGYLANNPLADYRITRLGYIKSISGAFGVQAERLRLFVPTNSFTNDTEFTVLQNGVATALTITVGGTNTGLFDVGPLAIAVADGDTFDLRVTNNSSPGPGAIRASAELYFGAA